MTHVYEIDPLQDRRWPRLVERHPRASVYHTTNWLNALHNTYRYDPAVISTSPPGEELMNGLVFCKIKSCLTGRRFVSLPFSDHCAPLVDSSDELDEMLLGMTSQVDEDGLKYLEIRPSWCEPGSHTRLGKSLTYCSHHLDVHKSKEELFRSFHKDCVQRKIRRALREKLRYEEGTSEVLLREFYRLLVMTRRRQGLPPQPMAWFRNLVAAFGSSLKIRVAYKDELSVASIVTVSDKRSMVYKYGCSDARFHKVGGIVLLLWNAIQEAKENGCEEVDMGRSDIDNCGLIAFKEHWGAIRAELSYWTYPHYSPAHLIAWQKRVLRSLASVSPDVVLRAVGNLLYRHIG